MHIPLTSRWSLLVVLLLASTLGGVACGDDDHQTPDAAAVDATVYADAGPQDSAVLDGAADASVDGGADSGTEVPLDGFGDITGHCGFLDEPLWSAADTSMHRNAIDFGAAAFDYAALSTGGQKVWDDGNLGGSSMHSEVFSYEVLYRCELATLLKTEAEILYLDMGGKKTDLLVEIDLRKVGVSVTRAFHWPPGSALPFADAYNLLFDKCSDCLLSAANAAPTDAWERSMLHVIAYDTATADVVEQAYAALDATTVADTLLLMTVTDGNDDYIYQ